MKKILTWLLSAGISKEEFKENEQELITINYKMLKILAIVSTLFFGISGLLGFFIPGMEDKKISYLIGAFLSLVAFIINMFWGKKKTCSLISIVLFEISTLGASLLITLNNAPEQLTITLIPVLVIVPLLFMNNPWKTNLLPFISILIYLICAPLVKSREILLLDIVDVIVFGIIGLVLGTFTVRKNFDRILAEKDAVKARNQFVDMLKSFSSAYNSVHYINLKENYFTEFQTNPIIKKITDTNGDVNSMIKEVMKATILDEYIAESIDFVDLETLPSKLCSKKTMKFDAVGKYRGWVRLEFTAIDVDGAGMPISVIFTTRSIDEEKKRENEFIQESIVDELTGLYNRRAFDFDIRNVSIGADSEYAYISLDVNGLKVVNDTKGHTAGDELLIGASECMQKAFARFGRVYRIGGDEFSVLLKADEELLNDLIINFNETVSSWKGKIVDKLAVSVGAVVIKNINATTYNDVIAIADKLMYENKDLYYSKKGIKRTDENDAFVSICRTYTKILKCSLIDDTFRIIVFDGFEEDTDEYDGKLSAWLESFGHSDLIYGEDRQYFLNMTDIEYLKNKIIESNDLIIIKYRRKVKDKYKDVSLEIIKTQDFTLENLNVYICVK